MPLFGVSGNFTKLDKYFLLSNNSYYRQIQIQREEIERIARENHEREQRIKEKKEKEERDLKIAILKTTGGKIPHELRDIY